jgi:hypothetical protein
MHVCKVTTTTTTTTTMARGLRRTNGLIPKRTKLSKEEKEERTRRANAQALRDGLVWMYFAQALNMGLACVGLAIVISGVRGLYNLVF